ncbi:uncharacterized protein LOC125858961 [Solanum stenotomum]|uniref:uncharacterized protein LOC125858961 n=1 Tax=Solanum stenotomum TaxID=172797 RepID=UPI0020D1674B|nr:uncharacterized protein LOC125858961 [Solanum stenotomum]
MATEGDVNAASTTNVRPDGGKKARKGKKHQRSPEEMLLEPTPSEALTSHPPSTTEASDDERGEEPIDVTAGEEWVARVEVARQAVEILGRRLNVADGKFKTLEDFTLEETENIRKELEGRQRAEFEMKEAITSLECRLMEALSTIETMKAEMKALKEGGAAGGSSSLDRDREARVEAPKPPMFKGVRDAQEVENFLWHLENYFKCNGLKSDESKINTAVLYLSEMAMLWWRRKEAEIGKGTCTINTWEQFREEFKKAFFPNNVIYEAKRKFRELKQTGSIRAYVQEFTTLTLQIPNLTDDDMLFHFMDGLQNWARTELERRQVRTIDEAITQAEALTDFRQEKPDRARGEEMRGSHDHGGGDRGKGEEQRPHPKNHDTYKSDGKKSGRHGNMERKIEVANKGGCYICGGPHGYARCPELKSLGAILRERKEKDAQEQGQGAETTQLGLIGLCGAITKQPEKPKGYGAQYVDLKINGKPACALVDTGAEVNLMTKKAATRLGLSYKPSNAQLRTVNAPPTPVSGVAHGVSITLGEWQGKANFTVAPLDLFDIILGQEFFQQCHAVIDPYLQRLLVMEQGGSCMVPMVKVPKTEGQVRLTAMQLEKNPKKKESTSKATIASSKKDNGARRSLPPCMKKVPKENDAVMPKKLPRRAHPKKEMSHKSELRGLWKMLKALRKGLNRVNGLLVAHVQGSDDDVVAMRRGRRINRWGRVSRPATSQ